jgi:hypothetical protein
VVCGLLVADWRIDHLFALITARWVEVPAPPAGF